MNEKLNKLLDGSCRQLDAETTPLNLSQIEELRQAVPHWQYCATENVLEQTFRFTTYKETINFTNLVAGIAEQEDHHPDMVVSYNRCKVTYSTHSINGLSENDFICAAKIDQAMTSLQ